MNYEAKRLKKFIKYRWNFFFFFFDTSEKMKFSDYYYNNISFI